MIPYHLTSAVCARKRVQWRRGRIGRPTGNAIMTTQAELIAAIAKDAGVSQADAGKVLTAIVENIQRQDLNAIEIALAYEHLLENEGMTQEKISERVGKSRAAIANYLRLLKLPAQVQMALQKKEIDMGHCRALLALDSPSLQIKLFKEIQKNGYSVRKVEEMVQRLKSGEDVESGKKTITAKTQIPEEFTMLREKLSKFLNTKVQFTCSAKGKGKISIPFSNEEELEHIMNVFDKLKQE